MMLVCFVFASASLSGCSTVEGMGKDIKRAGQTIDNTF